MHVLSFAWIMLVFGELLRPNVRLLEVFGTAIWIVFILEFGVRLWLAPSKPRFLKRNVITVLALAVPALRVLRVLTALRFLTFLGGGQVLILLSAVNRTMNALRVGMGRRKVAFVATTAVIVLLLGAAGMERFEPHRAGTRPRLWRFKFRRKQDSLSDRELKHPDLEQRQALLRRRRDRKMARSLQEFVRGAVDRFYPWLAACEGTARIPSGPPIWICGDCHLGNIGPVADNTGQVEVGLRDFDQAVMGNPSHDLVRLALSLSTESMAAGLSGVALADVLEGMLAGYARAMRLNDATAGRPKTPKPIRKAIANAADGKWARLAQKAKEKRRPVVPATSRFWRLTGKEREEIGRLMASNAVRAMLAALHGRRYQQAEMLDAAYWVKGCSSLGRLRYAVMMRCGDDDKRGAGLIDIKEAVAPACPSAKSLPDDPAQRVGEGARNLSPFLGGRMATGRLLGRPVFIRELLPQDLKLELWGLSRSQTVQVGDYLGWILGLAHARQLDEDTRRDWAEAVYRGPLGRVEAPSWLWTSVAALTVDHEGAYLEHCRELISAPSRQRGRSSTRRVATTGRGQSQRRPAKRGARSGLRRAPSS